MTKEELKEIIGKALVKAAAEAKCNSNVTPITTSAVLLGYLYEALEN